MEIKVVVSVLATLGASLLLAILNAIQANPSVLGGLPTWLQFVLITIIPPLAAFLGGYLKSSSTSAVSKGFAVGTGFTKPTGGFTVPREMTE